jgi:hypothetical protein
METGGLEAEDLNSEAPPVYADTLHTYTWTTGSAIAVFHSESITQILNRYPRKPVDNGLHYAWATNKKTTLLHAKLELLANLGMLDGDGVLLDGYGTRVV